MEDSEVFLDFVLQKLRDKPERGAEEEVRLRLMLQDLTDHNEALRRELQQQRGGDVARPWRGAYGDRGERRGPGGGAGGRLCRAGAVAAGDVNRMLLDVSLAESRGSSSQNPMHTYPKCIQNACCKQQSVCFQ